MDSTEDNLIKTDSNENDEKLTPEETISTKSYIIEEVSLNCNFTSISYNKNIQLLATGDSKGRISIWDYRTKKT